MKKIKIKNLDLRDGHQSYFATRMTDEQIMHVLPDLIEAGYYGLEVWGGATLDSAMRFLNQDPWVRLEKIAQITNGRTHLTALARGVNLFGYNPYPDHVVHRFNKLAVESGITCMRIFDALNDMDNLKVTIEAVKEAGGLADCAICYTVNPVYTLSDKVKTFFKKGRFPQRIYDIYYFVSKAAELEKMGADIITIKDMAGLIDPETAYHLITALKKKITVPVNLHSHCTPGYALASHIAAMSAGVDQLDVVSFPFAGGPSHPAVELVAEYAKKLGIDTDLREASFPVIRKKLAEIRKELESFDNYKENNFEFTGSFTEEQHQIMDESIQFISNHDFKNGLRLVHKLEQSLGFPPPDEAVRLAQIPGGMYSNMVTQLKELNLSHHFDEVLKEVPKVRNNAGVIPLVTPTSQIVGAQAVKNVLLRSQGEEDYSNCVDQYINLVRGEYGRTPVPISEEFRKKVTGSIEEKRFDTSSWKPAQAPEGLVKSEKDQMLLDLFPSVALKFLEIREQHTSEIEHDGSSLQDIAREEYERLVTAISGNYLA